MNGKVSMTLCSLSEIYSIITDAILHNEAVRLNIATNNITSLFAYKNLHIRMMTNEDVFNNIATDNNSSLCGNKHLHANTMKNENAVNDIIDLTTIDEDEPDLVKCVNSFDETQSENGAHAKDYKANLEKALDQLYDEGRMLNFLRTVDPSF